jgi:REP element-mobilizing transposase RayT
MARSVAHVDLFSDHKDRGFFLRLLADGLGRVGFHCYAWALMRNHYHLVLRVNERPLSALMRRLNAEYARYHSRKYDRRGYLFQDRFKSIATQDQGYIEELVRYVHLNPVRAELCRSIAALDNYRWCGHSVVMGRRSCAFQQTAPLLRRFGANRQVARRNYRRFIAEGLRQGSDEGLVARLRDSNRDRQNVTDHGCWVIGDPAFVRKALAADRDNRLRLPVHARLGWQLERVAALVERRIGLDPGGILRRGWRNKEARARKMFAYLARRELGFSLGEVARYLQVTTTAVARSLDAGGRLSAECGIRIVK